MCVCIITTAVPVNEIKEKVWKTTKRVSASPAKQCKIGLRDVKCIDSSAGSFMCESVRLKSHASGSVTSAVSVSSVSSGSGGKGPSSSSSTGGGNF